MNEREQKMADAYVKRINAPFIKLLDSQLSMIKAAFNKGDRERIQQNIRCIFTMLTPYLGVSKYRLKKRISDLGNITDHTEFITEADKISHIVLKFKEEKIDKINH